MRTEKTFKSVVLVVMLFALWMALCGCSSLNKAYVLADGDYYNATVPRAKAYIKADPALKDEDKSGYIQTYDRKRDVLKESGFLDYDEASDRFTAKK